ncbi:MAG: glycosyltransferase family 4 protein [Ilumatobacteraceae bacterium]
MAALRIAFDTGPLHGPRTGIGSAVSELHTTLAARPDVSLVDYLLSFRTPVPPGTTRLPLPATVAHRVWARAPMPRVDRWLGEVDVVHGTNYVVPPSRRPCVVSVYDLWFLRNPSLAAPAVRRAAEVLRAAVGRGAVVHTSSHATETAVRELLPGAPVRTVHLGALPVPPSDGDVPIPDLAGRPFIVAIGTVERRKNLPRLVAAFGHVAAAHRDLVLVLAGSPGDDASATEAAIDALGPALAPRVLRTGRIDDTARAWLLRHATAVAYPSLDEGFGFPLLDAMQVGVPLVASTAGSIPEVAGDAARYCDALDVDSIAAALASVLDDSAERRRLVDAGNSRWVTFTWQRCADGLVDLYRSVSTGELAR